MSMGKPFGAGPGLFRQFSDSVFIGSVPPPNQATRSFH
jgi:hypothetical protein